MLDLSSEIVCIIIAKAREFHAREQVVIPEEPANPSGDWARQVLADHADDLTLQEIRETINDLEPDQQMDLVALMWIGRGDFDASEWEQALEEARQMWTPHTAEYLMARPLVADYLEEGLVSQGYSCDE
jgi:hypothetical protein